MIIQHIVRIAIIIGGVGLILKNVFEKKGIMVCRARSSYVSLEMSLFPSIFVPLNQNAPRPSEHSPARGGKCQNV